MSEQKNLRNKWLHLRLSESELNSIGNNFNQSVKRLDTLDKISEIKTWAIFKRKKQRNFY
jgi:hypothetical protein